MNHHEGKSKRSRLILILAIAELLVLALAYFLKVYTQNSEWVKYQRQIEENTGWRSAPPSVSKPWIEEPLDEVSLWTDESKHFQLDSLGVREMESFLPSTGHTLAIEGETYTIAMFHQIKCLALIQNGFARKLAGQPNEDEDLALDCARYLWNAELCASNIRLESIWNPSNMTNLAAPPQVHRCRDWRALYRALEGS